MLKKIKLLREEKGISQQKLADAIGMSQSSINDYENRGVEPDISTLIKISNYFETSVDYIVDNTHIRRKIEDVNEFALNKQETILVNGYRSLAVSSRKVVDDLIADMRKVQGIKD